MAQSMLDGSMDGFAQTLKKWRKVRRFSQLDLATEAGISGRHLSFLETSRAHPSRGMVLRLSETLQLPLDARNHILQQAGFAAEYGDRRWTDKEMLPIRQAVDRMLENHMPYPGLAVDRFWRIVQLNRTGAALFGHFGIGVGDSLVDLLVSDAFREVVENWSEVARTAAARLRIESVAQGGIETFERAASHITQTVSDVPGVPYPVIPTVIRVNNARLSMFATIAQLGTPEDIVLDDLKVELYFPMDDETAASFDAMSAL